MRRAQFENRKNTMSEFGLWLALTRWCHAERGRRLNGGNSGPNRCLTTAGSLYHRFCHTHLTHRLGGRVSATNLTGRGGVGNTTEMVSIVLYPEALSNQDPGRVVTRRTTG